MKKPTLSGFCVLILFIVINTVVSGQNVKPFTIRYDKDLKGDMLLIGNHILNADPPNTPYTGNEYNDNLSMQYIDIDNDATTFSSSSANLTITPKAAQCYKIAYAGLYWSGIYTQSKVDDGTVDRNNLNKVKLKLPNGTPYNDIIGQLIYDGYSNPTTNGAKMPYAYYADVTTLLQGLTNANGTYTVANVISGRGIVVGGFASGWTLYVVYEDPLDSTKSITSFDGFSIIGGSNVLDIPISGFRTIPVGPVRAKLAFSCLEGDLRISGDRLRVNNNALTIPTRPVNNFFNSTINDVNGTFTDRVPNGTNLLGYDAGILNIPNATNEIINNGATSATISLQTTGDEYFYFLNAFAVDIIQPDINLVKRIEDGQGTDITNGNVVLGQQLEYVLRFQNVGNDDATNFTIKDILPVNVDFLNMVTLPPGVTYTQSPPGTLNFTIPDALVTKGGAEYEIKIKVKVVDDCTQLRDACSNEIKNQAYKTYNSANSGLVVENEQPSANSIDACQIESTGSSNFLVNVTGCTYERQEILCGTTVTLTAGAEYISYQWHSGSPATAANIIPGAVNQTYVATAPGTYSVVNTAPAPCLTITEKINVVDFSGAASNPVIPYANQVVTCPNDGSQLPKIFLCGAGDSKFIQTNILNATNIIWEKLDEVSCTPVINNDCPNTGPTCTWRQVGNGPNYTVNAAGQFRVRITFQGGCFRTYYFNAYQNLFNPTETHKDIICTTNGNITVNGVPPGYEYSLNNGPYQPSNIFSITTAGNYSVNIRQTGIGVGACVFTLANIPIRVRNFTVDVITVQPLCAGSKGSIRVQVNDVEPQYNYQLLLGTTVVNTVGPVSTNDYTFPNLNPGTYTVRVTTPDGCNFTGNTTITDPAVLTVSATQTRPITCNPGEITVSAVGGTAPYIYTVSGIAGFSSVPQIDIPTAGTYTVTVTDFNNCTATTSVNVDQVAPPVYIVTKKNVTCHGSMNGEISFNVTNTNGYTLGYSIDNGTSYSTNPIFSNLDIGDYIVILRYTIGTSTCYTVPATISITQPSTLSSAGGVSELAGCGPAGEGKVRITNAQGGVAPYTYSFDNGASYGTVNEAFLSPGTYTLYVKDANGCTFPMTVTLDAAPNPPTIAVSEPVFNCNGTAVSTVTVTNDSGNFNYTYLLDGVVNTNNPPNIFPNVSSGSHIISVQYKIKTLPTYSNLLVEDFGQGANTTTPGIAAAYCWNGQPYPNGSRCNNFAPPGFTSPAYCNTYSLEDNQYVVTKAINPNNCAWFAYRDHTSNGANPNGRFLAINIGSAAGPNGVLYSKPINDVVPNQPIIVELYVANLLRAGVPGADPDFLIQLVDGSNNVVASQLVGIIDNVTNGWVFKKIALNPGTNTALTFRIRSGSTQYNGNDAAIDDINVYQIPKVCVIEKNFPIFISTNKAFTSQITGYKDASCNGLNDGEITIAAQNFDPAYGFDYSLNNGTTWVNIPTSPVTVTGLAVNTYSILVRYNNTSGTCSYPFTQTISNPTAIVTTASVTRPATCTSGGTITTSASGGSSVYQYQLTNSSGTIIVPFQNSGVFSNIAPGDYLVSVRDTNGCTNPATTTITVNAPGLVTATIDTTSDFCYDGTNAATLVVTPTAGVTPFQYNINSGPFQSSNTFANLTPGNYVITVRDDNGCTFILPSQTIAPQLTINTVLTKDLDCTASPDAVISGTVNGGYPNFTYQVSVNGGADSAPVAVTGTTFAYTAPAAGTYRFLVTDAKGCTALSTVIINAIINPTATTTVTNGSCNGAANGSVTIIASSGTGPYNYSFNGSAFTTTTTYSSLAVGTYPFQVRDSKNCLFNGTVTITEPNSISGTAVLTVPYTCTGTATIEAQTVSGGTSPYTYSINGVTFQESRTFSGLTAGTFAITIKDANGCTFITNSITIANLDEPRDLIISSTDLTCPNNIADVNVAVPNDAGGVNPVRFRIVAPAAFVTPYNAGGLFKDLPPGTYVFEVIDVNNCIYQESFTITPNPVIRVVGQLISNVKCFGTATGAVRFTVSEFSPNYSYSINGGPIFLNQTATVINLDNLQTGTYTILVTDKRTNCTATSSVTVNQPSVALATTLAVTPLTCSASGSVVVNATGGWGGNTYTLTPPSGAVVGPQSGNTFANLTLPGNYTVTTTDSNGCVVTSIFTLTNAVPPTAVIASTSDFCYDGTNAATLVVTASGGVTPYQYNINGGPFQSSNIFANLTPGNYVITVRDAYGCTVTLPSETIAPQLTISTVLTKDLDCTASPNAVITGTINIGYPSFSYQVSINGGVNSAPVAVTGSTFTYTAPAAGTYRFLITDAKGCTALSTVTTVNVISNPQIASVVQTQQILCFGESTGAIQVNVNNAVGTPAFVINVFNTTTNTNYGTQTSGLPAGSYTITLTDAKSCTDSETIIINQPALINFTAEVNPITCGPTGTTFGSICVRSLTGGTSGTTGYLYTLTNNIGAPTQTHTELAGADYCFTVLNFGIYELSVTDANGCTVTKQNLEMASPPDDLTIDVSTATTSCATGATVVVTVSTSIPVGPYYFAIYKTPYPSYPNPAYQAADAGFPLQSTFTGLTPGVTYSFIVYDDTTKCYYFKQATAPTQSLSTLTAAINTVENITCKGNADGNVTFTISGYTATSVTYRIFNSQTNEQIEPPISATLTGLTGTPFTVSNVGPLAPGTYYILFRENNGTNPGCTNASATFTVTESATTLTITASVTKNDNCNLNAGQIAAIAQGGTAPYLYQILPVGSPVPTAAGGGWVSSNTLNAESGDYIAYVKDANNCITSTSVPITLGLDPSPEVTAVVDNQCTATEGSFNVDVTLTTAGIAPYSYSIDGGAFQVRTAPFTITNLSSGPHTVQVKDANGCGNTTPIINIYTPLNVTPTISTLPTCANNDGQVTVNGSGGSGNYNYSISPNPAGVTLAENVFSGVPSGTYDITIRDITTTCTRVVSVTLGAPTPVTFTATANNVSCNGGSNGVITVNLPASNNNPVYTYEITAPIVVAPQNSNVFSGLAAGSYTVKVNSGRGCSATQIVQVNQPSLLTVSGAATAFTCAANNSVNTSTVTITATNGTPEYTYSIDGVNYTASNTFSVIDNGTVQTITVYAKDSNGCSATNTLIVNPLTSITNATVARNTAITCTNNEIVTISVTGGSGNFNYQLLPEGAPQASNVFNLTAPGTYYFRVNDLTTGCYFATLEYVIAPFDTIQVEASATTPVTCFGDSNGAIAINVSSYTGSYNYQLFDSTGAAYGGVVAGNTTTNPLVIPGLPAGNYTVQVTATDSPFCNVVSNVTTVASPSAAVGLTLVSNINANCNSGAQVTVNGTGGTPGYTYAFAQDGVVPAAAAYATVNTAILDPTVNTLWNVYVKDSRGCITFINVTITSEPLPTVAVPAFAIDQCTSTGNSYTFTATGTGVTPLTFSVGAGFQPSGTFTVSASGSYTVIVKDANGCTATRTMTIYAPLNLTPTVNVSPSCANNDGQITISGSGGSGTYSYSISPSTGISQEENVFSGVSSGGPYTITITDTTTGCTKNVQVNVDAAIPVTFSPPTVINTVCNGGNDGAVTINLAPGNTNPVYTYQIIAPFTGVSQTSNVFTGLAAGPYTFRVTSGKNCFAEQEVTINQPDPIVVPAPAVTQFGCNPGTNGTNFATIQVSGMTGGSGTYNIYEFKKGTTIVQSDSRNIYTEADVLGGNYTITVYDSNGCTGTTTAEINPFIRIERPVVTVESAITCTSLESITIGITTIGGTPATLNYSVIGLNANLYNVTQTSPTFTGLTVGEYSVIVENPTTGCSDRTVHYVADPNTFNLNITKNNDVTCFGDTNGSISLTIIDTNLNPTNDAGPFTYSITNSAGNIIKSGSSPNAGPITITDLAAGIYQATVTLTSAPFCTSRKAFSIEQPTDALIAQATFTNPTCITGNNDGTISASASFGWPSVAYEYQLERAPSTVISAWSSTTNYSGLTPGNYIVRVRDSRGCVASTNVRLAVPPPISGTISASPSLLVCLGATNATITVSGVTGGQGSNYLYSLVNVVTGSASGAQPNNVFSNVGAGTYNVIISDSYSCTFTTANVIIRAPATNVTARLVKATNATCLTNATITLSASGGTAPYRYSATAGGPYSVLPIGGITLPPVTAGRYQYYVVDSNNCREVVSNEIVVESVVPVKVNVNASNAIINCSGGTTRVVATATDGLGNYVYSLFPPTAGVVQASPGVFTNVPAGNYTVQVVSGDCRGNSAAFTIAAPTPVSLVSSNSTNISCSGQTNGTIQVVATGGTGKIQYSISSQPGQTVNSGLFTNLAAGVYTVVYQDEAGCTRPAIRFTISEPQPMSLSALTVVKEACLGDRGSISFTVTGGTVTASHGYTASIGITTQTSLTGSFVFNNLPASMYLISVTDANNCPFSFEQILEAGVDINPAAVVEYPCTGTTATSTIRVTTNPAVPASEFTYSLDGRAPQSGNTFTNVAPGTHTISVTHVPSGCVKTVTGIIVDAITPLRLVLAESGLNQFTATTTGGAGGYTYTMNGNPAGSNNVFSINETGTYSIIVTDNNGCQVSKTIAMTFFDIKIPNFFTPDGSGDNETWTPMYTDNLPDVITEVYDRYGRKLVSLRQGQSWDGRYNNSNLPSGDYWYVIRLNGTVDGRQFVGHFTLYR